MTRVIVIGCGIVGAAIAYELSQIPDLRITVLDPHPPAQGTTQAALGVLMAVISQRLKGRLLKLRLASLARYETLIPELEQKLQQPISYNRAGILKLYTTIADAAQGQVFAEARAAQGLPLQYLSPTELRSLYPQVSLEQLHGALYSPRDRQVHPLQVTQALIAAAQKQGVHFRQGETAQALQPSSHQPNHCEAVLTDQQCLKTDWVVLCAGINTTPLLTSLGHPLKIQPVLGQALRLRVPQPPPLHPEPVITADDVHIVPLENGEYWVGATVEFGEDLQPPIPDPDGIQALLNHAIAFYPTLASGETVQTWSGLRPRPVGQSAPVVEPLAEYPNVLLATGHYRNGVLLAPITAQLIRDTITGNPVSL